MACLSWLLNLGFAGSTPSAVSLVSTSGLFVITNLQPLRKIDLSDTSIEELKRFICTIIYDWQEEIYDGANYTVTNESEDKEYNVEKTSIAELSQVITSFVGDNPDTETRAVAYLADHVTKTWEIDLSDTSLRELSQILAAYIIRMTDAVFKQCLDQIASDIQSLFLTGLQDYDIIVRWLPWTQHLFHHGLTVHPAKDAILYAEGTCGRDDPGYGCQVTMVESNQSDDTKDINLHLQWQELIRKQFIEQRLGSITSVYKCTVVTEGIPVPEAFMKKNYLAHALVVRCWSRETRGDP